MKKKAIILVNLGTPDKPNLSSIREFLKEFLSDKRVVDMPRIFWLPILYLFILPFRPKKILAHYQAIWQKDSPLRIIGKQQVEALQTELGEDVFLAMTYGKPALSQRLIELQNAYEELVILPLYPQYSSTTTESVRDIVKKWQNLSLTPLPKAVPQRAKITFIEHYHDNPAYIEALRLSIKEYWQEKGKPQKLLMSYHGLPRAYIDKGDIYESHCQATSQLLAQALDLSKDEWMITYQSRVGGREWLKPYTDEMFVTLPKQGVSNIHVVCAGFSVDCLETLDEIAIEGKEQFQKSGGETFHYIPALNANPAHIQAMVAIIKSRH